MARVSHRLANTNTKAKRGGQRRTATNQGAKRELLLREDGQCYARVVKKFGDGRFEVAADDGATRLAHVRGKLWKRVWIGGGDTVLICLRQFQDQKSDIIHKYSDDEVRRLLQLGELPEALAQGSRDADDEWSRSATLTDPHKYHPIEVVFGSDAEDD